MTRRTPQQGHSSNHKPTGIYSIMSRLPGRSYPFCIGDFTLVSIALTSKTISNSSMILGKQHSLSDKDHEWSTHSHWRHMVILLSVLRNIPGSPAMSTSRAEEPVSPRLFRTFPIALRPFSSCLPCRKRKKGQTGSRTQVEPNS